MPFVVRYRTTNREFKRNPFTLRYLRANGLWNSAQSDVNSLQRRDAELRIAAAA